MKLVGVSVLDENCKRYCKRWINKTYTCKSLLMVRNPIYPWACTNTYHQRNSPRCVYLTEWVEGEGLGMKTHQSQLFFKLESYF